MSDDMIIAMPRHGFSRVLEEFGLSPTEDNLMSKSLRMLYDATSEQYAHMCSGRTAREREDYIADLVLADVWPRYKIFQHYEKQELADNSDRQALIPAVLFGRYDDNGVKGVESLNDFDPSEAGESLAQRIELLFEEDRLIRRGQCPAQRSFGYVQHKVGSICLSYDMKQAVAFDQLAEAQGRGELQCLSHEALFLSRVFLLDELLERMGCVDEFSRSQIEFWLKSDILVAYMLGDPDTEIGCKLLLAAEEFKQMSLEILESDYGGNDYD